MAASRRRPAFNVEKNKIIDISLSMGMKIDILDKI
jgi:hypothetical protein